MTPSQTSALWLLLTQRPELLLQHGAAYAQLLEAQARQHWQRGQRMLLRSLGAVVCVGVAFLCAAQALMLLLISPLQPVAVLVLFGGFVALPLLLALGLLWCNAAQAPAPPTLQILQDQLQADWDALQRPASTSTPPRHA